MWLARFFQVGELCVSNQLVLLTSHSSSSIFAQIVGGWPGSILCAGLFKAVSWPLFPIRSAPSASRQFSLPRLLRLLPAPLRQTIQAALMSTITLVSLFLYKELAPYRRQSDTATYVLTQGLIYLWTFGMLLKMVGALVFAPNVLIGLVLLFATFAVVWRSVQSTLADETHALFFNNLDSDIVEATSKVFKRGDFIVRGRGGVEYALSRHDFQTHFEACSDDSGGVLTPALAKAGFRMYRSVTKVWACQLSETIISHLGTFEQTNAQRLLGTACAKFIASSGATMPIETDEFLTLNFPSCNELNQLEESELSVLFLPYKPTSKSVPSQSEVLGRWETRMQISAKLCSKTEKVHALFASMDGTIETLQNGITTSQKYQKGEVIMVGTAGRRYPMSAVEFAMRYSYAHPEPASDASLAAEGFKLFPPMSKIWAHAVSEEDIEMHFPSGQFVGKWGGIAQASNAKMHVKSDRILTSIRPCLDPPGASWRRFGHAVPRRWRDLSDS